MDELSSRDAGVLLLVVLAGTAVLACGPEPPAPPPARHFRPPPSEPALRGRLAEEPDTALLASARALLAGGGHRANCGPYPLYSDVEDPRLIAVCGRLASRLDQVYSARYGIQPRGEPASAIILFADAESYRAFARAGGVPMGYAGYALAARGLAVFYAGEQRAARASGTASLDSFVTDSFVTDSFVTDSFVTTLTHELSHLVNRRALGVNLPPWLAEGLADGVGDTATPEGFRPLEGVSGVEALAHRLRQAQAAGQTGDLERLVSLKRGEFDRDTVSFDYEQSALLVRFLLSERGLAAGFRGFLDGMAHGDAYDPERLADTLGASWAELDRRFTYWLREQAG